MLDELYQDIILQAARDTQFRGSLSGKAGALNVRMHNPLCGDSLDLWMSVEGGRVQSISFEGHGCLISQAAANLLAREIHDLPVPEAQAICDAYRRLIIGELSTEEEGSLGQLSALSGIRRIPARSRCALLSCEAVERVLQHHIEEPAAPEPGTVQSEVLQRRVANG